MIGPVFVALSAKEEYANIVFVKVDVDEVNVSCVGGGVQGVCAESGAAAHEASALSLSPGNLLLFTLCRLCTNTHRKLRALSCRSL